MANNTKTKPKKLTSLNNINGGRSFTHIKSEPIEISFGNYLQNKFKFKDLKKADHGREFVNLLDKMVGKTWDELASLKRKTDQNHLFIHPVTKTKLHLEHYGISSQKIRIHGFQSGNVLYVTHIDSKHKIHNK